MKKVIGVFIVLVIGITIATYMISEVQSKKTLPVLNPCNVYPALVDSAIQQKCVGHKISDFILINQLGDTVNQNLINNKIVVADFFFVSCPSICPKMNLQLKRVHDQFIDNDKIIILSHTVWPEVDSVSVLLDYAEQFGAIPDKWQFLTGNKKELYRMARESYLVVPSIHDSEFIHGGEADFIHTENIVLIDRKKRIRGYYDGTNSIEIDILLEDIKLLLN